MVCRCVSTCTSDPYIKGKTQVWTKPFGVFPNAAIVFPLGWSVSVDTSLPSMIKYVDFEFQLVGCAGRIIRKGTPPMFPSPPPPPPSPSPPPPGGMTRSTDYEDDDGGGGDETTAESSSGWKTSRYDDAMTLDELDAYECPKNDPYDGFTVIKVAAMFTMGSGGEPPAFAFMTKIRNLYISRLIMMFLRGPPPKAVNMMRPLLDCIGAGRLDASVNLLPYPVTLYTGTTIPGGILVDLEDVKLIGWDVQPGLL